MVPIIKMNEIAPSIYEMVIKNPRLAKKARAGHFVIVMVEETGERIPLTIADYDAEAGTITMVIMAIGTSTRKMVQLQAGDSLFAIIGPLGHCSEIKNFGTVVLVAGGVGTAPVFPVARSLKQAGNRVISIQGAKNEALLFWKEKLASVSDQHIITTDDGSVGRKALVTEPLRDILEANQIFSNNDPNHIGCVYVIGPAVMMKACAMTTQLFKTKTIASLNSIMIDGTGMCGGCRVRIGNETKFTCVDGPEFDAHLVDWNLVLTRQKTYCEAENCSLQRYIEQAKGVC